VLDLQELADENALLTYIGVTLLHYAPFFRSYQPYMEGYDVAVARMGELRETNRAFAEWLELAQKCENLSLESFLIMPVQRLPRYLLLLEELKRNTDKNDPSMEDITEAHSKIQAMASALNTSLRQKDAQKKVQELEKKFDKDDPRYKSSLGELATPTRILIKEGPLSKKFGKLSRQLASWKEYYFFLFNDIIVYTDKTVLGTYKLKHVVPLRDMKISKGQLPTGEQTLIDIKAKGGKSFPVNANSSEERDSWFIAIQKAIDSIASAQILSSKASSGDVMLTGIGKQTASSNKKLMAMMGSGQT